MSKPKTKTKILMTSDWHVDASTAGVSRFDEARAYVDRLVEACGENEIDIVCFLGDAFDPGSMFEGLWSSFMVEAQFQLTRASRLGSVFIPGNHDVIDSTEPISTLSPLETIAKRYRLVRFSDLDHSRVFAPHLPTLIDVFGGAVAILAMPYVSRAAMRTEAHREAFVTAMSNARAAKSRGTPVVVIGHYALPGITPGSEEEMMRGRDVAIPASEFLELGADLVVNGHYHKRQTVVVDGLTVEVVGAPTRFTFGEVGDDLRGYLIVEV